jgi:hypothetical protein
MNSFSLYYVYFWTFPQAEIKMHYLRPRGWGRCSQRGDYPENNLAKFGYILDMKVGKRIKQNPSIFLATYWILSLKSGDLKQKFLWNLANLGHFFHEIVFTCSTSLCLDLQTRLRKSSKTKGSPPLLAARTQSVAAPFVPSSKEPRSSWEAGVGDAYARAHAESIKQLKPIVWFSLNFAFISFKG